MSTVTQVKLTGLNCSACRKLIEKRLKAINGVEQVQVDSDGKTEIIADRAINPDEITMKLADTEFKLTEK